MAIMKKKELLEQIDALDCRLDFAEETIARLLDKNVDLELRIESLNKNLFTIIKTFPITK